MMSSGMETLSISIHASEKEATRIDSRSILPFLISIHASEKEATNLSETESAMRRFQSTPPRKRRRHETATEH